MKLPKVNPNEELEQESRDRLRLLLPRDKFEIRDEIQQDKGIDLNIELKDEGLFTNFRFNVQLKASGKGKRDKMGVPWISISTSNIQYLLNGGIPAFYIHFIKAENSFYYCDLGALFTLLNDKDQNWENQGTHTLKFPYKLDSHAINTIYESVLKKSRAIRKVNEKLALSSAFLNSGNSIRIDQNLSVNDDIEIRNLVESIGFNLINEGRWAEILNLHNKASGTIANTAKYNLIIGIAYYNSSELYSALKHFKKALSQTEALDVSLQNHLKYFTLSSKYILGIIEEPEFQKDIQILDRDPNLNSYLRIQNAKQAYVEDLEEGIINSFEILKDKLKEIELEPSTPLSLKLISRVESFFYGGSELTKSFAIRFSRVLAKNPTEAQKANSVSIITDEWIAYDLEFQTFIDELAGKKEGFILHLSRIYQAKVWYKFFVVSTLTKIDFRNQDENVLNAAHEARSTSLKEYLSHLEKAISFFKKIIFPENIVAALSLKIEILHFQGHLNLAKETINELTVLVEELDLPEAKRKLKWLLMGGMEHQRFNQLLNSAITPISDDMKEWNALTEEMKKMDSQESNIKVGFQDNCYDIELFPIGNFQFPKTKLNTVFRILRIEDDQVKNNLQKSLGSNGAIVNIFYESISKVGIREGLQANKGIENWRYVFRVRSAFFKNGFRRKQIIR